MSLADQMKKNKRIINRAIREMERERMQLEREQKKLEIEIKKMAKAGEMKAVRTMAKDLVRTKQHISKFHIMKSNLQGLNLKLQTMKTSHDMAMAMGKTTKAMKVMNRRMNIQSIAKLMAEFEAEGEKLDMTQEMMEDVMDDALDDGAAVEEEEAIVKQVLDEIGVDIVGGIQAAPSGSVNATQQQQVTEQEPQPVAADGGGGGNDGVSDLEARLNNLRRD